MSMASTAASIVEKQGQIISGHTRDEQGGTAIALRPFGSSAKVDTPADEVLPSLSTKPKLHSIAISLGGRDGRGTDAEASCDDQEGDLHPGLEAVDGGPGAYRFLVASGLFEVIVWGQSYVSLRCCRTRRLLLSQILN